MNLYFQGEHFKPYFPHPITNEKVFTFWDPPHMIKLVRNCIGDWKCLQNGRGEKICWQYFEDLVKIQEREGLRAANKVTKRHINFHSEIMKVKLAVQVLSYSVGKALLALRDLKYVQFKDAEATSEFCNLFNNMFDILNTRNFLSKSQFRKPVTEQNLGTLENEIEFLINYIKSIKDDKNKSVLQSNRNTGFLGMIVSLSNIIPYYQSILRHNITFLLTYKLSQDHLEMFFSAIRSRGGFNNNPSCLQFMSAYKKLLVRHQVKSSNNANCTAIDATTILHVSCNTASKSTDLIIENENIIESELIVEHDHDYFSTVIHLTPLVEDITVYIAGFVVKKVSQSITCAFCCRQLVADTETNSFLLKHLNRGKLVNPSLSVINICQYLERSLREQKSNLFSKLNIKDYFIIKTIKNVDAFSDSTMIEHIMEQNFLDNHRVQLIKLISSVFLKLRLHHEAKVTSLEKEKAHIRQKYTKLILFANQ